MMIDVPEILRNPLTRRVCLLATLLWVPLCAQFPPISPPAPPRAQPEQPIDPLGRNTPRGTVLGFLAAAQKGNMAVASQFLNTPLQGSAAESLARQLFTVLDRRLPPRLGNLSDSPGGSLSDLRGDQDTVGTISSDRGNVDVLVERVARGKSGSVWLFSRETLNRIPALYQEIGVTPLETLLPAFLVNTQIAGIALFEWAGVLLGLPAAYFFTVLLNRILSPLIGSLLRHVRKRADLPAREIVPVPLRLLLIAAGIHWILSDISLPLAARQFWSSAASILTIAACVWWFILLNDNVEHHILRRLVRVGNMGAASVIRLGRRALDVLVVFIGLVFGLYHFGLNPVAALAGLGVGGIAVALAAQKTLENVLGGISIIFDRVVRVGDAVQIGDTLGVIVDIGLRSTLIRTRERTLVSVPNGQVAHGKLENLSARDKFWFHPRLRLQHDTTSAQMHSVVQDVRRFLAEHSQVDPGSASVRLLQFGRSSLDLDVSAYVLAGDWDGFLEMQGDLLISVLEIVQGTGARIAFQPAMYANGSSRLPVDEPGLFRPGKGLQASGKGGRDPQ
jgi:MscS family membrane protein